MPAFDTIFLSENEWALLQSLYADILDGVFYKDHDRSCEQMSVLRDTIDKLKMAIDQ
jgi:hypothetical protein